MFPLLLGVSLFFKTDVTLGIYITMLTVHLCSRIVTIIIIIVIFMISVNAEYMLAFV